MTPYPTFNAVILGAFLGTAFVQGAILQRAPPVAVVCATVTTNDPDHLATPFCQSYLALVTRTATSTKFVTAATARSTGTSYVTVTQTVSPATVSVSKKQTVRVTSTLTPAAVTSVILATSTEYVDSFGNTAQRRKRDVFDAESFEERDILRAIPTPAFLQQYAVAKASMTAACRCFSVPYPTITRTVTAKATTTIKTTLVRTKAAAFTLPTPKITVTDTITTKIIATAPAPIVYATSTLVEAVPGCPPAYTPIFQCPEATGDDDGSLESNQLACGVYANDDYQGYCIYWTDDGAPDYNATLIKGDGSGDASNDLLRMAQYGDDDSDDCPFSADFTCQAPAPDPEG